MLYACLLGSLRWFLLGACWSGRGDDRPAWQLIARALALSLVVDLLLTVGLGWIGLYRTPLHLAILLVLCAVGALRQRPEWRKLLPGLLGINALILLTMILPNRMEWIVGGWDPGVYVNEGVELARSGSFTREREPFHAFLDEAGRERFTRFREYNFLEFMPVVPFDPERLATRPFFFPLYTAGVASGYSAGGLRLASRMNFIFGGIGLFVLAACLSRYRPSWGICAALLVLAQPLWWYHLNFPTTEVLMACLFACLLFYLPERGRPQGMLVCSLVLAAGTLCRIDTFLFGALLLAMLAMVDAREAGDRGRRIGAWLALAVPLLLAAGLSVFLSPDATATLGKDVPMIAVVGGMLLVGGLGVMLLPVLVRWTGRLHREVHWLALAGLLLLMALAWVKQAAKDDQPMIWQLEGMMWFVTWPSVIAAAVGFFALEWKKLPREVAAWLLMLAGMCVLVLVLGKIHQTWPWAARRYVPGLLPLLAVLGAWGLCHLPRRGLGVGLAALVLLVNSPRVWMAWEVMEDDTELSARFAEVVAELDENALLICDHYAWATPLRFLHGRHVVNGEQFWDDPNDFDERLELLASWPGEVVWVTSTAKGLDVFPSSIDASLRWSGPAFEYRKIKRSNYIGGFTEEQRAELGSYLPFFVAGFEQQASSSKQFQIWDWKPHHFPAAQAGDLQINVGDESAEPHLGRGWSRAEGFRRKGIWHDSQWVKKLEADVLFDLPAVTDDYDCHVLALPMFDKRLRQNVGLYLNGTFVAEWACPERPVQQVYTCRLPVRLLREGENVLTLRVGHMAKAPGRDSRKLALQVDKILLRPRGGK